MNIGIVEMGLIGGTYEKSLRKYPYKIYGIDINLKAIEYALANNIIDFGTDNPKSVLKPSNLSSKKVPEPSANSLPKPNCGIGLPVI